MRNLDSILRYEIFDIMNKYENDSEIMQLFDSSTRLEIVNKLAEIILYIDKTKGEKALVALRKEIRVHHKKGRKADGKNKKSIM